MFERTQSRLVSILVNFLCELGHIITKFGITQGGVNLIDMKSGLTSSHQRFLGIINIILVI